MDVGQILKILLPLPTKTEIFVLGADREPLQVKSVEVEHPADSSEGEVCVNIALMGDD